jgi:hypothetical protein
MTLETTSFGFTFGASHTQSSWGDARHVSWPDMVEVLTSHVPGAKEGSCLVPAIFTGSSRKKEEAAQIDVAFLDSDSGATLDDIVEALNEKGWEAVVSSTHSHMTTHTVVSVVNWDRYFAKHPAAAPEEFLVNEKGYLTAVAIGAIVVTTDATHVHLTHAPCPKFRVAVPLLKPWRAADYSSQSVANSAWKACIEAMASALNLPHDQACTDTSRLFYLPRRPPNGAVPETAVVSGEYCDIFSLRKPAEADLLTHAVPAKTNGHHAPSGERHEYADPITGEVIDLTTWARTYGRGFLIAKLLHSRRPSAITGLIVDNTKVHIRCPNEGAHTHPGQDNATFVVNAGGGATEGFVIHCRHAHCTGQDRLFFVGRMLSERWIEIDDLTAAEFQSDVPPASRNGIYPPQQGPPSYEEDPGYWQSASFDEPIPPGQAPYPEEDQHPGPRVFDPWNTLRPVSFPIEVIPGQLRNFILERARIVGADPSAIFWACLSACSAAIDGRIRLQMKRHDKWSVPPAIWVALVGLPSTKKTPIIDTAWKPLQVLQGRDMGHHQIALAQWKSIPKEERARVPEPSAPRRLVSHDATMEALQEILSKQDRGIGVLRDELAGWIGSMEKYAPGKGGAADRAFALQSYNGGSHVVDRVMRGTLPINNLLAVICGGIQPDRLRQFGDLTDDGLWQRFIGIIVAPGAMGEDEESFGGDVYDRIIDKLLNVAPATRLHLSDEAHTIREDVQKRIYAMEQSEVLGARFVGFVGKLTGLWGRLTMVLHLISEPSSEIVRPETAAAARTLLFRSVLPNAARIYTAMGGAGADVEATQSIAGYILTKGLRRIVMSDLTRNVRVCRHKTQEDVRRLLSPLEAGGWLMPEKDFAPMSWLVADQAHTQFEAQARKESIRRNAVRALITGHDVEDE